jgi:hypothetical protein
VFIHHSAAGRDRGRNGQSDPSEVQIEKTPTTTYQTDSTWLVRHAKHNSRTLVNQHHELRINKRIFDEAGMLRVYTAGDWDDSWIERRVLSAKPPVTAQASNDDDIPF